MRRRAKRAHRPIAQVREREGLEVEGDAVASLTHHHAAEEQRW